MNAQAVIQQLNQINSTGEVHVQTPSGTFVVSAVQQDADGAVVLRATDTPAGLAGQSQYQAQRDGEAIPEAETTEPTEQPAE
jgi:hypothetical protein